ncbi:MAG: HD domain-containing protein, partial [Lachnospiraceae bacterium]|nr:HD domain-containing protein [Lachnospiraceae bacterium]
NLKNGMIENAKDTAGTAAEVIDADRIDAYIREGEDARGYRKTADTLYRFWKCAADVQYLYVVTIDEEYVTFVFDVEEANTRNGEEAYQPGEKVAIEKAFKPYLPALLAGEEIEPIESNDTWSWLVTVYQPVYDSNGDCACYVGADVSLAYTADYMRDFALRVLLILGGFFVVIVAYGLWTSGRYMVYPINKMVVGVEDYIRAGADQKQLDEEVKRLRSIDVRTGDEIEKLYLAICNMATSQAEQLRSLSRFSENTARMQDGLIVTMADLVENRDSDTGAHIQKTAAYVKIIVEGLKRKGYYAGKITPKFMSDVVRSAPLHDIGKISIPDNVLNKPGRLTDEEYEIMKTHTTEGRKIMEKAIDTVEGENYLKEARNMAAYHHERWDGKGYPEGLHGEVIPLSARIMAVADVFDALASPRIYKPAFPFEEAISIIKEGAGHQFDPKCVEVFLEALPEIKVILKKYNESE